MLSISWPLPSLVLFMAKAWNLTNFDEPVRTPR